MIESWLSSIGFDPLLPWLWVGVFVGLAALSALTATILRLRSDFQRLLAALFLGLALSGPQWVEEDRTPLPDTVLILKDASGSMDLGTRSTVADEAEAVVRDRLTATGAVDVVTVEVPADPEGTRLARTLNDALASVPTGRLGGVIALTDGQVHDVPDATADIMPDGVPVHALVIGDPDARDRRIRAVTAPKFGVVGEMADFELRVDDPGFEGERAEIEVRLNGERKARFPITIGQTLPIPLEIERRGRNIVEMSVIPADGGELTLNNNLFIAEISGIRDQMRVLLITGEPHNGGRSWRNLLKSDPAIELVQFTILTQPRVKNTNAADRELALIRFPRDQLFEERLDDFDLIIFDQYQRRNVPRMNGLFEPTIPPRYFSNIARYVEDGGALLLATGPDFASGDSLYLTPLAGVLPTRPSGETLEDQFRPELNDKGRLHPITRSFAGREDQNWGGWYRAIGNDPLSGNVLMEGQDGTPLFVIDRVGDGRVAMLMSDQAWLWAKGHDGGGPYREMFRRTAHWLLGEPDLDGETLSARVENDRLLVERRTLDEAPGTAEIIAPDGSASTIAMTEIEPGYYTGTLPTSGLGAYRLSHGTLSTVTAVGMLNPVEFSELLPTAAKLAPLANATGGAARMIGLDAQAVPDIRRVRSGATAGSGWIGVRDNEAFTVTRSQRRPLAPPLIFFLAFFAALAWGWMREAK
ncbi:hypothetical protein [uncultured Algimonas sp.]|uniref:hypothetical protein n=1 Tax=uncultured Algimonas sp. TaxID=1547920 RepID=UPI00261E80A3|nr:hypothetical protein [uncultured Algimonas sp.]